MGASSSHHPSTFSLPARILARGWLSTYLFIYLFWTCLLSVKVPTQNLKEKNTPLLFFFFLPLLLFCLLGSPVQVLQVLRAGLLPPPLAASAPSFPREAGGEQNGCWRLRDPCEGNCSTAWPGEQRWRPGRWLVPPRPPLLHRPEKHHPVKEATRKTGLQSFPLVGSVPVSVPGSACPPPWDTLALSVGLVGHGLGLLLPCRYHSKLVRLNVRLRVKGMRAPRAALQAPCFLFCSIGKNTELGVRRPGFPLQLCCRLAL